MPLEPSDGLMDWPEAEAGLSDADGASSRDETASEAGGTVAKSLKSALLELFQGHGRFSAAFGRGVFGFSRPRAVG